MKIGVDGGVLYGTAYMREPYGAQAFSLYGLNDPLYRGLLQMQAERVQNTIRTGHRLGWQMSSHVTGDAGVDLVLDAVEAANADSPIAERRYTLIHAYFAHPDTAARGETRRLRRYAAGLVLQRRRRVDVGLRPQADRTVHRRGHLAAPAA